MMMENGGYLFVYFTGESATGEQVYFSVSYDGLHWRDLNKGRPVLVSHIGEKGVRDPFIIRSENENKFYIIATDLRMANGRSWEEVQTTGSRSIAVWESNDLIHWSWERLEEVGIPEAGCVWAPEAVYDEKRNCYLVFWASRVREKDDRKPKHRIYASMTRDFSTFTKPIKYIEKENDIIDTTIIRDKGFYYRISKDETEKNIRVDRGRDLQEGPFEPVECPELNQIYGVEGPEAFILESGKWCLIVDQFASNGGYMPLICESLENGEFHVLEKDQYDMGKSKKRHGSVIPISEKEMEALIETYGMEEL
ncbi:MAG: glycoside hydrolase family 43 protein [Lachnospiraceae bacterium]